MIPAQKIAAPKIALFDLDGTLVTSKHEVTSRTRMWLRRLTELGVITCCASGRPYFGALSLITSLCLRGPSITFGGALVRCPMTGQDIFKAAIPQEIVMKLLAWAGDRGVYFETYTAENYFITKPNPYAQIHATYLGRPPTVSATPAAGPILKCVVVEPSAASSFAEELRSFFPEAIITSSAGAANPEIRFLNITAQAANKVVALNAALAYVNLTTSDAVAFGDSEADLDIINAVGRGYVMSNALPSVKEHARNFAGDVAVGGIGDALRPLFRT